MERRLTKEVGGVMEPLETGMRGDGVERHKKESKIGGQESGLAGYSPELYGVSEVHGVHVRCDGWAVWS